MSTLGEEIDFASQAHAALLKVALEEGIPLQDLISQMGANIHRFIPMESGGVDNFAYQLGKRDFKPREPIVMTRPDGKTPLILVGAGETEVAELEDIAIANWEADKARQKKGEKLIDLAQRREDLGLPPKEKFDETFRQTLRDRIKYHKENHRTDPAPVRVDKPKGIHPT